MALEGSYMVAWPHVFGQNVTVAGTCDRHFLMDRRLRGLGELVRIAGGFFFNLPNGQREGEHRKRPGQTQLPGTQPQSYVCNLVPPSTLMTS